MTQRRRPPLSPQAAAIVRAQLSSGRLSRRNLLGGAGAMGLTAFLAACGTSGTPTTGSKSTLAPGKDTSATDKVVNFANWPLYLDYKDDSKTYPSLVQFEQATGIKATYDEAIDDNETYYAKIQGQLKNDQDIGKDIVVFTDWMADRVIKQGYAQKLDHSKIPNLKNMRDQLVNVDFDPGRNYSMTWQSGFTGLAWNKKALKALTGKDRMTQVSELWDTRLKGKVEVLSEMRDTIGLIMLSQGVDVSDTTNKFTAAQYSKAIDTLKEQIDKGQIRQVKGNSYAQDLTSGDAVAVFGWSGDIIALDPEKFEFALPETGGMIWSDNMLIPIASPHKTNAEELMNWYYTPKIAAEVAAYVNYVCPVQGAQEVIAASKDADTRALANSNLIFPKPSYVRNTKVFRSLTPAEETQYNSEFQQALGV